MHWSALVFNATVLLLFAAPRNLNGQTPAGTNPLTFAGVRISGSLRVRPEIWDWYDTSAAEPNYVYFASLLRLRFSQERPNWDWNLEFAQPLLLNLTQGSIAPSPQGQLGMGASYFAANGSSATAGLFAKQGFVRRQGILSDKASSLRFGRFEFVEGTETSLKDPTLIALKSERMAHRLVGNFGFSQVGHSFDGIQYPRGTPGMNVTLVAARATQGFFRVDGWGELDTDILYGALTRPVGKGRSGEWLILLP